jgi:hypothetical protein
MKELYFIKNSNNRYWSPFQHIFIKEKRYMLCKEAIQELKNASKIDISSKIISNPNFNNISLELNECINSIESNTFTFMYEGNVKKILGFLYNYREMIKEIKEING